MNTLFDTSILIAHLRGDARATDLLESVTYDERLVSILTRVEIEGGMRSAERAQVASLFGAMRLQPVTDAVARRAGEHLRTFRRSHTGIDLVDYVVAATAELQDAWLVTLNVRHFPMFAGHEPAW